MAGVRRLPEPDVLAELVRGGLNNREIAERYGVTAESVRQAKVRAGLAPSEPRRPSHGQFLPWRVRSDHTGDVLANRLRLYSNKQQGRKLTANEERMLEEWIRFMEGGNGAGVPLSVHYNRTEDQGFWLEPRRAGDRDFISPPEGD